MLCEKAGKRQHDISEESIILMTPYRLPHHGNRSFTDATDDVLPSAVILSRSKNIL